MSAPAEIVPAETGSAEAETEFARATALWQRGEREAAVACLREVIARDPSHAGAQSNLGNALLELGAPEAAVEALTTAAGLMPGHASASYNLGNAQLAAGRGAEAEASFRQALALDPTHAGAWNNLGNALRQRGEHATAAECYRQALHLRPELAGPHNNLGSALLAQHRPDDAAPLFARALALQPDYAEAANNLGGALLALDRQEEALVQFRRAIAADPGIVQAYFGASLALLSLGRYREGWEAYESRWLDPRFREGMRDHRTPRWRGERLGDGTLLVHAEQGLGDTVQFVRFLPLLRPFAARLVLMAQAPLLPLLDGMADAVLPDDAEPPAHTAQCPLLSLPFALGTEVATIPASVPYLSADPARRAAWRARLGPRRRPRIGLAFSGSAEHPEDALRSIPARAMLSALRGTDAEWHVVQRDIRPADAAILEAMPDVRVHAPALSDFGDTAALVAELDLIVSVDTSIAHLAGALARPVWVLVQCGADFRWLRERADSPWYPTARLFRQSAPRRWEPVLARVAAALRTALPQLGGEEP